MKFSRKVMSTFGAKAVDDAQGIVEAYCSVFNNVDYAGEIVRPGFFAETITAHVTQGKSLPKILWSHSMWDQPLGVTQEAEEVLPYDSRLPTQITSLGGLRVVGKFNLDTTAGHDAFSNIRFGALDQYSIGYYVIEEKYNRDTGLVELLKGDWIEWSPVNFAANAATLTVDAKGGDRQETTEHIYVVRPPSDFKDGSYKRVVMEHEGKNYTIITGVLRTSGVAEEASIRFDADAWDADDARGLCTGKGRGTFEAATAAATVEKKEDTDRGRLLEHGARMVAQVSEYLDRVDTVKALRLAEGKAGRVLSEANRTLLAGLLPDLKSVMDRVQKLLDDTAQSDDAGKVADNTAEMKRLYWRMLALNTEITASEVAS